MTTDTLSRRSLRPRGLSFETQVKVDKIMLVKARRDRIRAVRAGLQAMVEAAERSQEAQRIASVGGGEPTQRLVDALCLASDFDALMQELSL